MKIDSKIKKIEVKSTMVKIEESTTKVDRRLIKSNRRLIEAEKEFKHQKMKKQYYQELIKKSQISDSEAKRETISSTNQLNDLKQSENILKQEIKISKFAIKNLENGIKNNQKSLKTLKEKCDNFQKNLYQSNILKYESKKRERKLNKIEYSIQKQELKTQKNHKNLDSQYLLLTGQKYYIPNSSIRGKLNSTTNQSYRYRNRSLTKSTNSSNNSSNSSSKNPRFLSDRKKRKRIITKSMELKPLPQEIRNKSMIIKTPHKQKSKVLKNRSLSSNKKISKRRGVGGSLALQRFLPPQNTTCRPHLSKNIVEGGNVNHIIPKIKKKSFIQDTSSNTSCILHLDPSRLEKNEENKLSTCEDKRKSSSKKIKVKIHLKHLTSSHPYRPENRSQMITPVKTKNNVFPVEEETPKKSPKIISPIPIKKSHTSPSKELKLTGKQLPYIKITKAESPEIFRHSDGNFYIHHLKDFPQILDSMNNSDNSMSLKKQYLKSIRKSDKEEEIISYIIEAKFEKKITLFEKYSIPKNDGFDHSTQLGPVRQTNSMLQRKIEEFENITIFRDSEYEEMIQKKNSLEPFNDNLGQAQNTEPKNCSKIEENTANYKILKKLQSYSSLQSYDPEYLPQIEEEDYEHSYQLTSRKSTVINNKTQNKNSQDFRVSNNTLEVNTPTSRISHKHRKRGSLTSDSNISTPSIKKKRTHRFSIALENNDSNPKPRLSIFSPEMLNQGKTIKEVIEPLHPSPPQPKKTIHKPKNLLNDLQTTILQPTNSVRDTLVQPNKKKISTQKQSALKSILEKRRKHRKTIRLKEDIKHLMRQIKDPKVDWNMTKKNKEIFERKNAFKQRKGTLADLRADDNLEDQPKIPSSRDNVFEYVTPKIQNIYYPTENLKKSTKKINSFSKPTNNRLQVLSLKSIQDVSTQLKILVLKSKK